MAISSKNDPTIGLKNSSQDGNGPKGKMRQWTNEKLKSESFLLKLHHLKTPFIILVPKLIVFLNIELNTQHGLTIHSYIVHYIQFVLNLPNISSYSLYAKV